MGVGVQVSLRNLRTYTLLVGLLLLLAFFITRPVSAAAGVSQQINFQGRLLTSQGATVPDGYYNIQFNIYQDGDGQTAGNTTGSPAGSLEWTETYLNANSQGVLVKNGFLSVQLGTITPFGSSVNWNQDTLWLSMNVAGIGVACTPFASCSPDGEMVPMKRLSSTPYALNSGLLGGVSSAGFVQLAQGLQTDASTNTNSIYINKTSTGNFLALQSGGNDAFTITNSGDVALGNNANHSVSVSTSAAGAAGKSLTVSAGGAGTGSALAGGNLVLQGGAGSSSDGTGGNVAINAGVHTGAGADGTISIGTITAGAVNVGNATAPLTLRGSSASTLKATNGTFTTTLGFVAPTADRAINLPNESGTVCLQNSGSCGFATGGTESYIQNQGAAAQPTSNFWISGTGTADTALQAPTFKSAAATALTITGNAASTWSTSAGLLTLSGAGGVALDSSAAGQTIAIGNSAVTHTIAIGTGAAVQDITIGSTNGASSLALRSGTGALSLETQGTGGINIGTNAIAQTVTLGNSTGATSVVINSGTGAINVGTNAIAHTVTLGNATGATSVVANCGTGACDFGANAIAHTTTIGTTTGAGATTIQAGTGNLNITTLGTGQLNVGNNAVAQTVNIGNVTGATALNMYTGTGNFVLNGVAGSTYAIGAATTTGTITIGGTAQTGALSIGTTSGVSAVLNLGVSSGATGVINLGTGTGTQTVHLGDGGTGAKTVTVGSTASTSSTTIQSGTGNLNITTLGTGQLNVGNNAVAQTINVGNTTGATALNMYTGTGNFSLDGVAGSTYTFGASTTTGSMTIGGTAQTGNLILGSSSGTNTVAIANGSGASTVNIANVQVGGAVNIGAAMTTGTVTIGGTGLQTGTIALGIGTGAQTINIGTGGTGAKTVTVGSTASTGVTKIQSGTGGIVIGNDALANTIQIGNTTGAVTQALNFGNNNTAGSTTNVVIGAGGTATGGTTAIQSKGNTTVATNGVTRATFDTANNLYLGNGVTAAAPNNFVLSGTGSATTAVSGGQLTLQGGNATVGTANGGNLTLSGGSGVGGGVNGLVVINNATYSTSTTQSSASNINVTQANVDSFGAVILNATAAGVNFTLGAPTLGAAAAGRVIYVTAANGSPDFTLRANVGGGTGVEQNIAMRQNTTATMIWNGSQWTAAGASSSTTLQSAYDNTLQSAGGAELIVSKTSNTNGLTIRDSSVNPVNGTLLSVQTSSAAPLFSVNSNVTEYSTNGGAETAGGTPTTFPAGTWSAIAGTTASRYVTAGDYIATGQGSVSALTTAVANTGIKNQLASTLSANTTYSVSFTTRLLSGTFTDMNVWYSIDGTAASVACTTTATSVTSIWTKVNCTFTTPASGITANNAILIRQTTGVVRTFYADNLSVTIAADYNFATDGDVGDSANFATNWPTAGLGTVTTSRLTTDGYDASDSAQAAVTAGAVNAGVRNKLSSNPLASTLYRVTVYGKLISGAAFTDFKVRYSFNGNTTTTLSNYVDCVDYNTQTLTTTGWTKVTCYIKTDANAATNPYVYFAETTSAVRTFAVDTFSLTLATITTPNVQVGGGINGGPTTLFTLDKGASAPIASNNDALLGSMYYDTTLGKLQCYEADGWGACGSSPDNIVTISPEFTNAVMHGTGVGTMISDICSDNLNINDGSSGQATICGANETYNFYKWTSPQPSAQTYSIYVTYQLPTTFKSFASGQTSLMGRTDSANSTVQYTIYLNNPTTGLTPCGSATVVSTGVQATWRTIPASGTADPSTCGFNPGDSIVFKIDTTASVNANAYVGNLNFTFSNK